MKFSIPLLALIVVGIPAIPAAQAQNMPQSDVSSTSFQLADGTTVRVNSRPGQVLAAGPAPDFAQLDADHNGSISRDEAAAYTLLANDFQYADSNDSRGISKSEYSHWTSLP